jgi:Fe(3+) dicitrate transport protein
MVFLCAYCILKRAVCSLLLYELTQIEMRFWTALVSCAIGMLLTERTFGQVSDTLVVGELKTLVIEETLSPVLVSPISPKKGTYLFAAKKSESIAINAASGSVTEKISRQLLAKVPGVFVYDMEGGNQMNIAVRGLDPHRAWEFNLRKDGVIINSDMYAYPASHYSIPMESVSRIELVRGTGSLQYGAQFGGMLNYVTKEADQKKPFSFESFNTMGSYQLLNSYNAIGGKWKKWSYYAYYSKRTRNGFRDHERTEYDAQGIVVHYRPTEKWSVSLEWARSNYVYQAPGPLTDSMFAANPRQATRSRNFYSPTIQVPSLKVFWKISEQSKLQFTSSMLLGDRKSVLFDRAATIPDTISSLTQQYAPRQVDIDRFNSSTQELRFLHSFGLWGDSVHTVIGVQFMLNELHRTQQGKGTTGTGYDLSLTDPIWGRDMRFRTNNTALFFESNVGFLKRWTWTLGARMESGISRMTGKIVYYPENEIPVSIEHQYVLLGTGIQYKMKNGVEWYGGIAQSYRPMIFKEIIPVSIFEKVDPDIEDSFGYNAEIGVRGKKGIFQWDMNAFALRINNRFGTIALPSETGDVFTLRTNTGNSLTTGIEMLLQAETTFNTDVRYTFFTSNAFMNGRYVSGLLKQGNATVDISGNAIESVPALISRNGVTALYKNWTLTFFYSYTSETFADALNTEQPNATGSVGIVPDYSIVDMHMAYKAKSWLELRLGVNNLGNANYFTKRPLFYPGPGIWPSDGRNGQFTVILTI